MADRYPNNREMPRHDDHKAAPRRDIGLHDVFLKKDDPEDNISKGVPLEAIVSRSRQPPLMSEMDQIKVKGCVFMITPFKYDSARPEIEPTPMYPPRNYKDKWDSDHVLMPCSPSNITKTKQPMWDSICLLLNDLKTKCKNEKASFEDLKQTIEACSNRTYDMACLEALIVDFYSKKERSHFMSTVLPNICRLALHVDEICGQPPPLLKVGEDKSVTMSQRQAASLLACAFFCLFPLRSVKRHRSEDQRYQEPNFDRLYRSGPREKIEKIKCILHYFGRITEKMPNGVITFRRFALSKALTPKWPASKKKLSEICLTAAEKIEDIPCTLQVDFANKFIGGGVLGAGCVQEEIRFSVCPEMLVSLLVCEVMEPNECIFLIGCERFCSYKGYANQFEFDQNYNDKSHKDNWGRKWSHLVAMDAIPFDNPVTQYEMKNVHRELNKAYASFRPRKVKVESEGLFGIATGSWGCGVFNGDKELKAIIQWMAASESERPLIYAAYRNKNLVLTFFEVYEHLKRQQATVADLYRYLERYSTRYDRGSLFEYIMKTPLTALKY